MLGTQTSFTHSDIKALFTHPFAFAFITIVLESYAFISFFDNFPELSLKISIGGSFMPSAKQQRTNVALTLHLFVALIETSLAPGVISRISGTLSD